MAFDPDLGQLKCPYCGHAEAMPEVTATRLRSTLQEHDLAAFINTNRTQIAQLATTAQEVSCPGCRATISFEPPDVAGKCPFCATSIVTQESHASDPTLAPSALVPFTVGRKIALKNLRDWLAFRWDWKDLKAIFLPGQLKQLAQNKALTGVYLPFWTYDAQTARSEEHTSELQSRPHISYAVFCLKKKKKTHHKASTSLASHTVTRYSFIKHV